MRFKVGDPVVWSSQAGGCKTTKAGRVLLVVPAGVRPYKALENALGSLSAVLHGYICHAIDARTLPRKEESYIVEVPGKPKGKWRLYWPTVPNLKLEGG